MIPFRVEFRAGVPLFEQVVYAARKAMVSGQLRPGDPFPSVRSLSRELKINPNTAHKVVTTLIGEGMLETLPGVGTVVSERIPATRSEKTQLLGQQLEELAVSAKKLGIDLHDLQDALSAHWKRLGGHDGSTRGGRAKNE